MSAASKRILLKSRVLFGGNKRNLSPTLRIFENEVPVPFTRTDPEAIVTEPAPVTLPLI